MFWALVPQSSRKLALPGCSGYIMGCISSVILSGSSLIHHLGFWRWLTAADTQAEPLGAISFLEGPNVSPLCVLFIWMSLENIHHWSSIIDRLQLLIMNEITNECWAPQSDWFLPSSPEETPWWQDLYRVVLADNRTSSHGTVNAPWWVQISFWCK